MLQTILYLNLSFVAFGAMDDHQCAQINSVSVLTVSISLGR